MPDQIPFNPFASTRKLHTAKKNRNEIVKAKKHNILCITIFNFEGAKAVFLSWRKDRFVFILPIAFCVQAKISPKIHHTNIMTGINKINVYFVPLVGIIASSRYASGILNLEKYALQYM